MNRIHDVYRPCEERKQDFAEVERHLSAKEILDQASRCQDCGIPFCHGAGCPLGNVIPEFNAAVARGEMKLAYQILSETSFFPEFTSRVCPALCEGSCTCGINDEPVMIRQCEKRIIETAFERGWVRPVLPQRRNGKRVSVIGSGPSGLYVAEALNRAGFEVTVYEANHHIGGLLRYGIPDFKLDKRVLERRQALMMEAGIRFMTDTRIGVDVSADYLRRGTDAVVLAIGTPSARDLTIPGRELDGIHFALEFLQGQNRVNGKEISSVPVSATGKRVLVIGGGDTGSDCVGTSIRQGAASVRQVEIMPRPPELRSASTPWPQWPYQLRTSSSHKEGCEREWNVASAKFLGENGHVTGVEVNEVAWETSPEGRPLRFTTVPGTTRVLEADLVLLAMGFTGVPQEGLVDSLGLVRTKRQTLIEDPQRRIFVTGDCANGATLVVRAMADAKKCAARVMAAFE